MGDVLIVEVEQRHIANALHLASACPFALAIKEACEKFYADAEYRRLMLHPINCARVEVVVSVSSSILVTNHFIMKRKGREEVELGFQKFHFGADGLFNINDPALAWMVAYGHGQPVQPTTITIKMAEGWSGPVAITKLNYTPPRTWNEVPPWGAVKGPFNLA